MGGSSRFFSHSYVTSILQSSRNEMAKASSRTTKLATHWFDLKRELEHASKSKIQSSELIKTAGEKGINALLTRHKKSGNKDTITVKTHGERSTRQPKVKPPACVCEFVY